MTADSMRTKRRSTYQNMHEIVKLAKKYSPKLVKGYSAGNISVVDKKSWLEVCDHKHRYVGVELLSRGHGARLWLTIVWLGLLCDGLTV